METFERTELKYILTKDQYEGFKEHASRALIPADFHDSRVVSLYYDTKDRRIIRRSLEKPEFKEKLRIRTYGKVKEGGSVFVELKKKLDGVVYKRRTEADLDVLREKGLCSCAFRDEQVGKEILRFYDQYEDLEPAILIEAHRVSYVTKDDPDLRITFDEEVNYRMDDLDLTSDTPGKSLLPEGIVLMEIKSSSAMPLWLTRILSKLSIYPHSFSKYGAAYIQCLGGE